MLDVDLSWLVGALLGLWGVLIGTADFSMADFVLGLTCVLTLVKLSRTSKPNPAGSSKLKSSFEAALVLGLTIGGLFWTSSKAKESRDQRDSEKKNAATTIEEDSQSLKDYKLETQKLQDRIASLASCFTDKPNPVNCWLSIKLLQAQAAAVPKGQLEVADRADSPPLSSRSSNRIYADEAADTAWDLRLADLQAWQEIEYRDIEYDVEHPGSFKREKHARKKEKKQKRPNAVKKQLGRVLDNCVSPADRNSREPLTQVKARVHDACTASIVLNRIHKYSAENCARELETLAAKLDPRLQ